MPIKKPPLEYEWIVCPYCGAKTCIKDDTAECKGVYVKCTRGCRRRFEVVIKDGKQILDT